MPSLTAAVLTSLLSPAPLPDPSPTPLSVRRAPVGAEAEALLGRVALDPPPPPPEAVLPVDGAVHVGDGLGERAGGHDGVDLLAECGRPLRAIADGTIVLREESGSAGRHVILRMGGRGGEAVYMHLERVSVRVGQRVQAGDRLGTLGDSGNATTCHLHFERWAPPGWHQGEVLDPEPRLRAIAGDAAKARLGAPDPGPQRSGDPR